MWSSSDPSSTRSLAVRLIGLVVFVAHLGHAAPARAHLGHVIQRAERYLKIEGSSEGIRVVVSLTLGREEAVRVLTAADEDADGTVTREEADAYMARWGEGLETDLPIELDGRPVEVEWGEPFIDPVGPIRPLPGSVEMIAHISTSGGPHVVTVHDRMRAETFDRTDVTFRARDGATIVRSGPGEDPQGVTRSMAYGADGTRTYVDTITAELSLPAPPEEERRTAPWWIGLIAAGVLVVAAFVTARGRTRSPPEV